MEVLERRFAAIGARVKVAEGPKLGVPQIDIRVDRKGEYFDLRFVGGDEVELEVVDDGDAGVAENGAGGGHGLLGMRERVALYGGELETVPAEGGGYRVRARLPLARASA